LIVYGEKVAQYVGRMTNVEFYEPYTAIGESINGEIIAGFVFNVWTQHDVEVSLAARRLNRALMRAVYTYVVIQLGCRRATFRTRSDNIKAQRALSRLGARREGCQRLYFGDCDGLIYGLMKEDFPHGL
jgi:RimJ/RimL family protein N-acetyltransferase